MASSVLWQSLLEGAVHVQHGFPHPRDTALRGGNGLHVGGAECFLKLSEQDAGCLALPPGLSGSCVRPSYVRWRANEQPVGWHQDGDGRKRTDAFLGLRYVEGSCRLSLRIVDNPDQSVDVDCRPGTVVVFDNARLEHCVLSDGYRSFFGPFLVSQKDSAVPCAAGSRGGELCCPRGVETCCGNMCRQCRLGSEARERGMRAPVTLRHSFTYVRENAPDATLQLVEQSGGRRVVFDGKQPHGSWHWLVDDTLEISFNARPWKPPHMKAFHWKDDHWHSVCGPDDSLWRVVLLPSDAARDAPAWAGHCKTRAGAPATLLARTQEAEAGSGSTSGANGGADRSHRPDFYGLSERRRQQEAEAGSGSTSGANGGADRSHRP
jgi:hypothetical protein